MDTMDTIIKDRVAPDTHFITVAHGAGVNNIQVRSTSKRARTQITILLNEEGIRDLISALQGHLPKASSVAPVRPMTAAEHNKAEFAKIPVGAEFSARYSEFQTNPRGENLRQYTVPLRKVDDEHYTHVILGGIDTPHHIKGMSIWYRDFVVTARPRPKPATGKQIAALAVGDTFTVVYESGVVHMGIKVDDDRWFSYKDTFLRDIQRDGGASLGTVTKS